MKFLKYAGIGVGILVLTFIGLMFVGQGGENSDKINLEQFAVDSAQYFEDNGNFLNVCSSDMYRTLESGFSFDITCVGDKENEGNSATIIAKFSEEGSVCAVTNYPPVDGKPQKRFHCVGYKGPAIDAVLKSIEKE